MRTSLTANVDQCKRCAQHFFTTTEGEPPCIVAYRALEKHKRLRPQLRFVNADAIGNPCAVQATWKELRHFASNPGKPLDTDAFGTTALGVINRAAGPHRKEHGVDLDDDWWAESSGFRYDTVQKRRVFRIDSAGERRVPIVIYPNELVWKKFLREIYYSRVTVDPYSVWIGAVSKAGGGAGMGAPRGGDAVDGSVYNVGCALYSDAAHVRGVTFTAELKRTKSYGAGGGAGFNLVIMFGLNRVKDLQGHEFTGSDINFSIGLALGGISKIAKYPRVLALVKAIKEGNKVNSDLVENAWTAIKSSKSGLDATMAQGRGIQIALLDLPAMGVGLEVAYVEWTGKILTAEAFW
ncbi:MAG TPA: hypothetical protein VJ890_12705 [Vineibacter sp.]|nr:hypothetical protein [Vineibacter sp.]